MDNQKQIEEMANIIKNVTLYGDDNYRRKISNDSCMELAEELLKHYQPKLPEGSVVLSKEEYEGLQIEKDFNYGYHEGEKNMEAYYENIKLPDVRNQARKQAVKEFAERLHSSLDKSIPAINGVSVMLIKNMLDEIAKEMGVEVE